jgi:hypothetical protein
MTDRTATNLTAEDRLDILDLCARYYISTDEKDVEGFMDCWVPDDDIVFKSAFGDFAGRAAVRQFEDEHVHRGMAVGKRHLLSNVSIRPAPGAEPGARDDLPDGRGGRRGAAHHRHGDLPRQRGGEDQRGLAVPRARDGRRSRLPEGHGGPTRARMIGAALLCLDPEFRHYEPPCCE